MKKEISELKEKVAETKSIDNSKVEDNKQFDIDDVSTYENYELTSKDLKNK